MAAFIYVISDGLVYWDQRIVIFDKICRPISLGICFKTGSWKNFLGLPGVASIIVVPTDFQKYKMQ